MRLIDILPQLEAIARQINFQPLDDLIQQIRRFCEHMLRQLTPGEPIREGSQALNAYADRLNDLTTQLNAGLAQLEQGYTGPASAQYFATTTAAIQRARRLQTHINDAATYHSTLANHCIEATFQQGMLVAQGAMMAIDLSSLIFTAGLDAPISVPVAAGDAVVAEGSAVAMDAAVDGADAAMSAIGDSAADLGTVTGDLSEDGASALEEGGRVGETGAAEGDPAPTAGGAGSGEEPPGEGGNGSNDGSGSDGSDPSGNGQSVNDAMDKVTNNPNRLNHIFGQAKHLWSRTGLTQDGNLGLIRQAVQSNWQDVLDAAPQPYEVTMEYNGLTVVVRGILQGDVLQIADAWIAP